MRSSEHSAFHFPLRRPRLARLAAISLLLPVGAGPASASSWVNAKSGDKDAAFQFGLHTATQKAGVASIWMRVLTPSDRKAPDHRTLLRFDCTTGRVATVGWARHNAQGKLVDSGELPDDPDNYRQVSAGAEAEAARLACNLSKARIAAAKEAAAQAPALPPGKRVNIDLALRSLGGRVTSSTRTREEQRQLHAAGRTRLLESAHIHGRARDIVGLTKEQILQAARKAGLAVRKLVWETGHGLFQGTGAHWHLEWADPAS